MTTIADRLTDVRQALPQEVTLVAVSKFHPAESLAEAYAAGQRIFGESHVQEMTAKYELLPKDIAWHFIGHLQTNKVKYLAPYVSLIHAVDSLKLLREIDRQAAKVGRVIDCLIQVHVAQEASKFGFTPDACLRFFAEGEWRELSHVRLRGLMCMASFVDDEEQIRREFTLADTLFSRIKADHFAHTNSFGIKSWGMTDDHRTAIACGSNMVRIGTRIFGHRTY